MTHPQNTSEGPNPSGMCMCGCGQPAPIAKRNARTIGHVLGKPVCYISGHNRRRTPIQYVVDRETGCWVWQWSIRADGYGSIRRNGRLFLAHRYFFEQDRGPIPEGLVLDHLCRNRACVNPEHLEAVPMKENTRRGDRTRLTPEAVREIRSIWARGELNQGEIGKRYGVSRECVAAVIHRRSWKNVE